MANATVDSIPILLYHSVPAEISAATDRLSVPLEHFAGQLDAIAASGRSPITIGEHAAALRGEEVLPERPVCITFDDGYDDTLAAIELLRERRLCATVYITTGQIGERSMIGVGELRALADCGPSVELGAHSVTHPHLDEIDTPAIDSEVSHSKEQLEQIVGRSVDTFAYPYGSHDRRVREAVIAGGYSSAAAVKNALSHPDDDPWAIARWTVRRTTTAEQIERLLAGQGAPRAWRRERLRTTSYRAVRRARRRFRLSVGGS
jgi:peptidoglycan/xylan/chitin deacetylase (PgdA/CDA1 family)